MKKFKDNFAIVTFVFVALFAIISCEEDFENLASEVLKNNITASGEVALDVKITPIKDLGGVRADNIALGNFFNTYWLGNFRQNAFSKSIKAGFVSQLSTPNSLSTTSKEDPVNIRFFLDKVLLKIPYKTSVTGAIGANGETLFQLDSILPSNASRTPTKISVYRNPFFLNTLDITDVSKQSIFKSDIDYFLNKDKELLSEEGFSYVPSTDDTEYFFDRINRQEGFSSTTTFKDSIVINPRVNGVLQAATLPFLTIPLDLEKMKAIFWDKFEGQEFATNEAFQDYFKGLVVLPEDEEGILVPFSFNTVKNAQLSFIFSIVDATDVDDIGITYREYNFPFNGVTNAIYEMSSNQQETTSDTFVVQGTDGSNAEIEILGVNLSTLAQDHSFLKYSDKDLNNDNYLDLSELSLLKDENGNPSILINDASLNFYINNAINTSTLSTPNQLHLYQDRNYDGEEQPINISDAIRSSFYFGGNLKITEEGNIPDAYTFKITDFISNFIEGSNNTETKLLLKVFNEITDEPIVNVNNASSVRELVEDYNWNPRSVVLFNETASDLKKAQIKVVFSELKN